MPAQAKPCPGPQPCSHSARGPCPAGHSRSVRPEMEGQPATAPSVSPAMGQTHPSQPWLGRTPSKPPSSGRHKPRLLLPMQGGATLSPRVSGGTRQNGGLNLGEDQDLGVISHLFVIKMKRQGTAGGRTKRCSVSLAICETQTPATVSRRFRPFRVAGIKK